MFEARTVWAIALLLAPMGAATAAGVAGTSATAGHTAYVKITVPADDQSSNDLAKVSGQVTCEAEGTIARTLAWLGDDCEVPPGSAVYVSRADTPDPRDRVLQPTGIVYLLEEPGEHWNVREYVYGPPGEPERYRAYVLDPKALAPGGGGLVQGVVNLTAMDVDPGEKTRLEATLGAGPSASVEDPTVRTVHAHEVPSIPSRGSP